MIGFWTARRLALPLFVVAAVLAAFNGLSAGLVDADWWWHLETGRLILDQRMIPPADPFSWTHRGEPWVLQSWLFQAGLAWLWQMWGEPAVAVSAAVLLALGYWIAFITADRLLQRPALTAAMAVIVGAGIIVAGAPRPQLISLVLFALYLAVFCQAKYGGKLRPLVCLPVLMILWVNVHGAFVLGAATVVGVAVLEWAEFARGRRDKAQRRFCLWLTAAAVATLAATGLNPWGYAHWAYPFYVTGLDLTRAIVEWQSIMRSPLLGPWYAVGGAAFFLALASAPRRPHLVEMLAPAALFVAGLMQARHAPFASIAMLVFVAPSLWRDRAEVLPWPGGTRVAGWLVAVLSFLTPLLLVRDPYPEAIRMIMPSDITAHIAQTAPQGRMFNDYAIGGYLIHRLGRDHPVFIDGRADLYGDAFFKAYLATVTGAVPLNRHFDGWEIGYAILRPEQALTQMLLMRGWRIAFHGRSHLVLLPPPS
ncbi:MAG: hypothetical protein AAF409_13990 [Pseudomonadota bacterium]